MYKFMNNDSCEDDVWLLNLDHMKNYKNYFSFDNPCNLDKKFDFEERLKRIHQKQISSALTLLLEDREEVKAKLFEKKQRTIKNQKAAVSVEIYQTCKSDSSKTSSERQETLKVFNEESELQENKTTTFYSINLNSELLECNLKGM